MQGYFFLSAAILSEVVATTALKIYADRPQSLLILLVFLSYGSAFWMLTQTLKYVPLSVTYAVWAGTGTALVSLIGVYLFKEALTLSRFVGIIAIIAGVVILNASTSVSS